MRTQIQGAEFLASRKRALLADEPRVGKTGAALLAAELLQLHKILVITTASGRAVWRKAFADWLHRTDVSIFGVDKTHEAVEIASWQAFARAPTYAHFIKQDPDLIILDECHFAKNPDSKTAQAVYGDSRHAGVASRGAYVWQLSGTPAPHDLGDLFTHLRFGCPERIQDVLTFDAFRKRYCIVRMKKISNFNSIPVVVGSRNEKELKERIGDYLLRRTQKDIGIRPSVRELMPLIVPSSKKAEMDTARPWAGLDTEKAIIQAIEQGRTAELDMHLGPLRRITGRLKAEAIIPAVEDALAGNNDKLVLAYFHREVGDILEAELSDYRPMRVDGSSGVRDRDVALDTFTRNQYSRVFLAQIDAASEAIDLSAAAELWFVESMFSPRAMLQMSHRIANVNNTKPTFVKVATIEGSIDEAIQASLLRLWSGIKQVIS